MRFPLALAIITSTVGLFAAPAEVRLWETNLVIPTYLAAPPSPVPRFYEGRTYQGAKATFYPYPIQDVLTDIKTNKSYKVLFLENDYVQISVIPELGGRIWSATDKVNGYDFFYRQHVVKPALIGMLGAWISGGVEWNVPHHHRASSFMPVDNITTTNADGSVTVWVGEIELRHRMKWLVGLTLHPDRSYLELNCKVHNPTPFAWPMLFWINPAVHANTNYQVLFPPGTEWTAQHSKPEFASWPIARQTYGGNDYTRGVDISWWKNHDTPKSFFAWNYEDDWFGGYDHGRQAGVIHWADHHVAPGKKFFEWGNGPEGEMWTKILTDDDGPYLELMAGAWSDNQPDYSWIQPGETREWKHWWYPVRDLGGVKAATRDAAVNLEVTNRTAMIAVNTTKEFKGANVRLALRSSKTASASRSALLDQSVDLSPAKPFAATVVLEDKVSPEDLMLVVSDTKGAMLITYQPLSAKNSPMPKPVEKPRPPKDYASTDELYFTGQRVEQLYSPSFEAAPYYEEMLRRDPGDYRANTAMGILLCRQWRWDEAAKFLSNAVARATANYIRPKDGEALYYLGVALKAQGKLDVAYEVFQQAVWRPAWQPAGGCELAEIDLQRRDFPRALENINLALTAANQNSRARNLKATILRKLDRIEEAERLATGTLVMDPLNVRAASEQILAQRQRGAPEWRENVARLRQLMGRNPEAFLENTFDFANAGQWSEVVEILRDQVTGDETGQATIVALEAYLLAVALEQQGQSDEAARQFAAAGRTSSAFSFPSRFEEEPVLRRAMEFSPGDANAPYLLGCLLYDNQPENAIKAWEEARRRDGKFALTHRNLGLAYAQHEKNIPKAIASLERAIELNPTEPRFFYELDAQYEAAGTPVATRLEMLTKHHEAVAKRDDALTREIVLLTAAGRADRALESLRGRRFRNWEGSSQTHGVYVDACIAQGLKLAADKKPREALANYRAALEYPENLEVGRARRSPRTARVQFLIGTAHEALGDAASARGAFEQAVRDAASAKAASEQALAGRDGSDYESDYFGARAMQNLGRAAEAKPILERLVKTGEEQLAKGEGPDYFAKFGEKTSERVRQANAHYLIGLGQLGLGEKEKAGASFRQALELHPAHPGAREQSRAAAAW
jgi:tetratricopeptide (TPR) repeat protein